MIDPRTWSRERVEAWVADQGWYQSIPVADGLTTPGTTASVDRLRQLDLPDLTGKSVLDVGCNSGMYCFEAARCGASRVVGIDLSRRRLKQARTLSRILQLDVELLEMELARAKSLGRFDVVFCFAVLTETSDLISSLLTLKAVTRGVLYLELAVLDTGGRSPGHLFRRLVTRAAERALPDGIAGLRRTKNGWALMPSLRLIRRVMGDEMSVLDLGTSVRYRLLKLVRRGSTGEGADRGSEP